MSDGAKSPCEAAAVARSRSHEIPSREASSGALHFGIDLIDGGDTRRVRPSIFFEVHVPTQRVFKVDFPDGPVLKPSSRAGYVRGISIQCLPVLTITKKHPNGFPIIHLYVSMFFGLCNQ